LRKNYIETHAAPSNAITIFPESRFLVVLNICNKISGSLVLFSIAINAANRTTDTVKIVCAETHPTSLAVTID
jgi:hypothetical protein